MRAFIDTNIFVYATYSKFSQFPKALRFLKDCLKSSDLWYLSWGVAYEYLRVVTHPQLFPEGRLSLSQALDNIARFTQSPNMEILQETSDHLEHLQKLSKHHTRLQGNILHDGHLVVLMEEHDLKKIITSDTDFHRFKGIEVINPLKD